MFRIKEHVRKGVRIAAIGTAASFTLTGSAQGATLYFDPGSTPTASSAGSFGSGGSGTMDNTTVDWSNTSTDQAAADGSPAGATDNVHFGGTTAGGTVTTAAGGVNVDTLAFDTGGYTINGSGAITLNTGGGTTILSSPAGVTNTINPNIATLPQGLGACLINVGAGGTLNLGTFTFGHYGTLEVTGGGTVAMGGYVTTNRPTPDFTLLVNSGALVLQGSSRSGNVLGQIVTVAAGGTLAGNATANVNNTIVTINGHLVPHNPLFSNSTGNFNLVGGENSDNSSSYGYQVTFGATGNLDLNLVTPDFDSNGSPDTAIHDTLTMTGGTYVNPNTNAFTVDSGAVINLNTGLGDSQTLVPGTYDIITLYNDPEDRTKITFTDENSVSGGPSYFTVDNAPAGYSYQVVDVPGTLGSYGGTGGIDLIVTAAPVPEPSALGLLTVGAGAFLLRRRRKSRATGA